MENDGIQVASFRAPMDWMMQIFLMQTEPKGGKAKEKQKQQQRQKRYLRHVVESIRLA